jgi:cation diffusion facilitator family transporter
VADSESQTVLTRYSDVSRVLSRVLVLNLLVAVAKIAYGYAVGAVSIASDGFHSLTDGASNVVALFAVRVARQPPDADHPYGHRKFETLASGGIFVFLLIVMMEVARTALVRFHRGGSPAITATSFVVMAITFAVNVIVVRYESAASRRLSSELLLADAMHTRSDLLTSLTVIAALAGTMLGYPILDPVAGLVVAAFIGKTGFEIAREASGILADHIVIAEDDLRAVVMSVPGVLGCHRIRTRGSTDHVFLDLHVWMDPATPLFDAHAKSHDVKDQLMTHYPQIADAVIHIEPPPQG